MFAVQGCNTYIAPTLFIMVSWINENQTRQFVSTKVNQQNILNTEGNENDKKIETTSRRSLTKSHHIHTYQTFTQIF